MTTFGFLVLPAANRVYGRAAIRLAQAELAVFGATVLQAPPTDITSRTIGGVPYITFVCDGLEAKEVAYLSNLSSIYALFELDGEALRPLTITPLDRYDDDLLTIQRYTGKTNEQFTKLLLNVTLLHSRRAADFLDHRARVLDPLCGRGTTLNQVLMYGFDGAGIELDARAVDAYETFLKTWLKDKRLKHKTVRGKIRRDGRVTGHRFDVTIAADKDAQKAGETQRITVISDDTRNTGDHFSRGSFDVVVADLPYAVQHGRSSDAKSLLVDALPAWKEVLAHRGAIGLSWNTHVLQRDDLTAAFDSAGLDVVDTDAMRGFAHRVDQAINRDLVVATKCR